MEEIILPAVGFGLVWAFFHVFDPKTPGDGAGDPFEGIDL